MSLLETTAPADWRMTGVFLVLCAVLIQTLKIVDALERRAPVGARIFFWLSPLPAVRSLSRVQPLDTRQFSEGLVRLLAVGACFLGTHWILGQAAKSWRLTEPALSYLGAPLLWLGTGAIVEFVRILYMPWGRVIPRAHDHVLAARSVSDFWGRRWNVWMSDWFRDVVWKRFRRRPALGMFAVFFLSGIIHEGVLNFGLWLVHGRNQFGSMMIYFLLQAVGVEFERAWLGNHPWLRRIFLWVIVIGPVPLIVNESLLRSLQFWHG